MSNNNRKTVTANVYDSDKNVRVSIPVDLFNAPTRAEISTGIRLCGWHRGRKWGIEHIYNCWQKPNSQESYGDEFIAYRLDIAADREVFDALCEKYSATCYRF